MLVQARWLRGITELPILLSDGRSLRLDTIATVTDQSAEQRRLALLDGKPVIAFSVTRAWGASVAAVADGAERAVAELQRQYPRMRFEVIDNTEVLRVRESYQTSMEMLVEGAVLAGWAKRCGAACAKEWNETVGKALGLTAPTT